MAMDFMVWRSDLRACRASLVPGPGQIDLQPGQVLLRIDKFAFTPNNVAYAVQGDANYLNVFAAPEGWARIPVWGFADVVQSRSDAIGIGERYFGLFPMSTHLVVRPERMSEAGFSDGSPHRATLQPVYNRYTHTATDPTYEQGREGEHMLMLRLFMTSFLIDDFLADNGFFGAQVAVLSGAATKTAWGLAFLLSRRERLRFEVIGMASAAEAEFARSLGCYDRVLTHDEVASLPGHLPAAYIDIEGIAPLRSELHHYYRNRMKHSCLVNATQDPRETSGELPGAAPCVFSASDQIRKRTEDWGPGGLQQRFARAWRAFLTPLGGWMRVVNGRGPAEVERAYVEVLMGQSKPDEGQVLTLHP